MESQNKPEVNKDENDLVIFRKIVTVILTAVFCLSLILWIPLLLVLPIVMDGGLKLNAIALIIAVILYPIWAGVGLQFLWKDQEPGREFGILTATFFLAFILSLFA